MIYELSEPSLNFRKETNYVSKVKKEGETNGIRKASRDGIGAFASRASC